MTVTQKKALKNEAEALFYHGYNSYMKYAFPEDELRPLSCSPLTRDRENPAHFEINDVLGNYSLTLVDNLSTLAVLASAPTSSRKNKHLLAFQNGVKKLVYQYGDGSDGPNGRGIRERGFNVDSKVQVFETVIRGVGGLLSAHLFAIGELPIRGYAPAAEAVAYATKWDKASAKSHESGIKWGNGMLYDGQLLRLAYDLGNRLIPAFYTPTGIPYPRVNLRHGVPFYEKSPVNLDPESGQCDADEKGAAEITETCSAGAGSLVLEFTVLSRLTGDDRFEDLAKRAFWAIWSRRSAIGLIGSGIDAENGTWVGSYSGIGAGIDSFFEYALKSHVLLSKDSHLQYAVPKHAKDPRELFKPLTAEETSPASFLRVWSESHTAIKRHLYRGKSYQHPHYIQGDLYTGATRGFWIDSLSSFYPGLLTLAGEIDEAIEIQLLTTALWTRFSALPERWNVGSGSIEGGLGWWGGRPEFIESNYYLYRATRDPWYLHVGEMTLRDIKRRCWTRCGWAGIQDVKTGKLNDRMESFFLSETAKYLFLLFDENHPLNHLDAPFVFSTEGHPLIIPSTAGLRRQPKSFPTDDKISKQTGAPATCPKPPPPLPLSVSSTAARNDVFHAAVLARLHLMPTRETIDSFIGEYAVDHPSIALSDIQSPSNYTYFPWTLPPQLVSPNATSAPLMARPSFDISFPALSNMGTPVAPLQRVKEGILINHIGGLRLGMVKDVPILLSDGAGEGYRIHVINNLALGKDEKVFLARDTTSGILNPTDPNFTRIRDTVMLDLVVDLDVHTDTNRTEAADVPDLLPQVPVPVSVKSALATLMEHLTALLNDQQPNPLSLTSESSQGPRSSRFYIPAITATGVGAAPIPDWSEAPSPTLSPQQPRQPLDWTAVYATDELCDHKIPLSVAKMHQILLVKRGGCAFGTKLANVPAFAPAAGALQLVVVVSYEPPPFEGKTEEEWLIRPLLEQEQKTGAGLVRRNPLPMVMVGGGERTYEALRRAVGVGIKRRYTMEAQGVRITNLIIV